MKPEQQAFVDAVQNAQRTFNNPRYKQHLGDLSPRFWVALLDLELSCTGEDWDQLKLDFKAAYRRLGAPGDFGYGTPCGDALRKIYDTWNALCKSHAVPAPAEEPCDAVA